MANREHIRILNEGVNTWNKWRENYHEGQPDLSGADLAGRVFGVWEGDRTAAIKLRDVNLSGANLTHTDLRHAHLGIANLTDATLYNADLSQAYLENTVFRDADLRMANLTRAEIIFADFSGATFGYTTLADLDLSTARGLDTVRHKYPSPIGIDTIMRSFREVPEAFLRGVGVPETLISYLPSLLNTPIQFYSCFISYSTSDQEFADRLYADLQHKGIRCWFAPHDVQAGKKIHEQIDDAIRVYDRLLLLVSEHSMKSEWVKTEIAHARQKEVKEQRRVLFPIGLAPFAHIREWKCFDADTGKDSAREIREFYIPDFSDWKSNDSYQKAFLSLMRDLVVEEKRLRRP